MDCPILILLGLIIFTLFHDTFVGALPYIVKKHRAKDNGILLQKISVSQGFLEFVFTNLSCTLQFLAITTDADFRRLLLLHTFIRKD